LCQASPKRGRAAIRFDLGEGTNRDATRRRGCDCCDERRRVEELGFSRDVSMAWSEQGYEFLRSHSTRRTVFAKPATRSRRRRNCCLAAEQMRFRVTSRQSRHVPKKVRVRTKFSSGLHHTNVGCRATRPAITDGKLRADAFIGPCPRNNKFVPISPPRTTWIWGYSGGPNNPTGSVAIRAQLSLGSLRAGRMMARLLFDAAYEAYCRSGIPHSLFRVRAHVGRD